MIRAALIAGLLATNAAAEGIELSVAGTPTRVVTSPAGSLRLPIEVWSPETTVSMREGALRRTVYQYPNSSRTTLQLIQPVRRMLEEAGYQTIFSCADVACGGFDFRFQLDLLPEPDMHVDLGNYRYVIMEQGGAEPHTVSLVASASATAGFLHVTEVSDAIFDPEQSTPDQRTAEASPVFPAGSTTDLISTFIEKGRAVLWDLEFATGSSELSEGPYASLNLLADWLLGNPSARIVLVGHTDAVGSLDANTTLSRRRATAVATRLVEAFQVNPAQLQSAGAGFLSPIASNLTPEGRQLNRRVEAVLLSVE